MHKSSTLDEYANIKRKKNEKKKNKKKHQIAKCALCPTTHFNSKSKSTALYFSFVFYSSIDIINPKLLRLL